MMSVPTESGAENISYLETTDKAERQSAEKTNSEDEETRLQSERHHMSESEELESDQDDDEFTDTASDTVEQDIAGDLETFVQLVKVGDFDRAKMFFEELLESHINVFPVAAEYCHALLEQGAFEELLRLFDESPWGNHFSGEELQALRSKNILGRLHKTAETREVEGWAPALTAASKKPDLRDWTMLEMHLLITSLCISDEFARQPLVRTSTSFNQHLHGSFLSIDDRVQLGRYRSMMLTLCQTGHLWKVRLLVAFLIRHPPSDQWLARSSVEFLRLTFDRMPSPDGHVSRLIKLAILTDYAETLLVDHIHGSGGIKQTPQGLEALLDSFIDLSGAESVVFWKIETGIQDSRCYKYLCFLRRCFGSHPEITDVRRLSRRASRTGDIALSISLQLILAAFQDYENLALHCAYGMLKDNSDKLTFYRLISALSISSSKAKSIRDSMMESEWTSQEFLGDIQTVKRELFLSRSHIQRPPAHSILAQATWTIEAFAEMQEVLRAFFTPQSLHSRGLCLILPTLEKIKEQCTCMTHSLEEPGTQEDLKKINGILETCKRNAISAISCLTTSFGNSDSAFDEAVFIVTGILINILGRVLELASLQDLRPVVDSPRIQLILDDLRTYQNDPYAGAIYVGEVEDFPVTAAGTLERPRSLEELGLIRVRDSSQQKRQLGAREWAIQAGKHVS